LSNCIFPHLFPHIILYWIFLQHCITFFNWFVYAIPPHIHLKRPYIYLSPWGCPSELRGDQAYPKKDSFKGYIEFAIWHILIIASAFESYFILQNIISITLNFDVRKCKIMWLIRVGVQHFLQSTQGCKYWNHVSIWFF
jgi:hypothetical protein